MSTSILEALLGTSDRGNGSHNVPMIFKKIQVGQMLQSSYIYKFAVSFYFYPHAFSASGILQSPPSVCPSVKLSPPKPLDKIQPNLVCELLT